MENEQVESATTDTTETETQDTATSAETENTEGGRGPIPYERFKEVNDKWKIEKEQTEALAEERDALQRRVDEMAASPAPRTEVDTGASNGELPTPPAGLSERATVEWYVKQDAERMLEGRLGMSLDDAATLLKSIPQAAQYTQERQWEGLCAKHGLDPNDQRVRKVTSGLLYSEGDKADPEKVVAEVAEMLGAKKPSPTTLPPSPRNVETDGVGTQLTVEDFMPGSKEEATKAAAEGKRAPFISTTEINRRMAKLRAK